MDPTAVPCATAREFISADIDGEHLPPSDRQAMDRHQASCAACRQFADQSHVLRRTTSMRALMPEEDRSAAIVARLGVPDVGRAEWIRFGVGVVGAVLALVNLPVLVLAEASGADAHASRHLGAFGLALGFGFLYAAWRPERALGLLPLTAALGVAMLIGATVDLAGGRSTAFAEAIHVVELIGIALLWALSGGRRRLSSRWRSRRAGHTLRPA